MLTHTSWKRIALVLLLPLLVSCGSQTTVEPTNPPTTSAATEAIAPTAAQAAEPAAAAPVVAKVDPSQLKTGPESSPAQPSAQVAYEPGEVPIAMIPAAKRTSEMWMEYLGIRLVETRDSSGPRAFTPKNGDLYFVTNESTTWGATNQRNNVVFFDAKTRQPVIQTNLPDEYSVNFGSHSVGVSADGKWLYLPAQGPKKNYLLIIDGETLKLHKVYESLGRPHHINNYTSPEGKELMMVIDFGWNWSGSGIWVLDPAQDNAVVGGMSRGDFSGNPYIVSREVGEKMWVAVPAATSALREKIEGSLARINLKTWKVEQLIPMYDPIWPEVSVDGKTAWVTLGGPSKIVKVDLEKGVVLDEIATGPGPWGARLNYDETKIFTADKGETYGYGQHGRTMSIIDTENNIATNVVFIGETTDHIVLSPDGKEMWATSNAEHLIKVVSVDTEEVVATIQMPNDGDTHGSTFIEYSVSADGKVTGEVLSSFSGLRGKALAAQQKVLTGPKPTTVSITGFNKFNQAPGTFSPTKLEAAPGQELRLSFVNKGGTSSGVVVAESKDLGIAKISLKPGLRIAVNVVMPTTEGEYKIVNPDDPEGKPLVITVKKPSAAPKTDAPKTGNIREIPITADGILWVQTEVKVKVGETVVFVMQNKDDEKHNLVGIGDGLNLFSPDAGQGQTIRYEWQVPDKTGKFKIICAYHPAMIMDLVIDK